MNTAQAQTPTILLVGDAVEFDAGPRRGTFRGVVTSTTHGSRTVGVRASDGRSWRVPRGALRPAKLTDADHAAIQASRQEAAQAARREVTERQNKLAAFAPGDKITFGRSPATHEPGVVVRVNGRTITLRDAQGRQWRVGPTYVKAAAS
jgi:transcription elongation factor